MGDTDPHEIQAVTDLPAEAWTNWHGLFLPMGSTRAPRVGAVERVLHVEPFQKDVLDCMLLRPMVQLRRKVRRVFCHGLHYLLEQQDKSMPLHVFMKYWRLLGDAHD